MTFAEFLVKIAKERSNHPHERTGQAYFNMLVDVRPELANHIRGGTNDPFYDDRNIGNFLEFLGDCW